jgi:DNA polymerase-3 subunit epsilon
MEFVAIDVETANADISSICQIGIAKFKTGKVIDEYCTLIDPEDYFDEINVCIHGITEYDIRGAPKIPDISQDLYGFLDGAITVCHTHFDRVSIGKVLNKYEIRLPETTWLDSARVARRTWKEIARKGYGLLNVCEKIGYEFRHHNALQDAKASGHILIAAINKTGLGIEDWLKRVKQPIDPSNSSTGAAIRRDGNSEGALYGENIAFTGALEIPRKNAADMAARIGCTVGSGVTKQTTILVVGDQDVTKLAGNDKSLKHRKAEGLIAKGQTIRILKESDFKELVNQAENDLRNPSLFAT